MMDSYQAIYDGVRSRISNGDIGSAVERAAFQAFDIGHIKMIAQAEVQTVGYEMIRPSVLFRPEVSLDGDCYMVLYGSDLMAGCAGFGKTMALAMEDFDKNWAKQPAPHSAKAIEARSDKTGTGLAVGESAAPAGSLPDA